MAVLAILTVLLACSAPAPKLPAGDPARPDVIVVSIDSLRPDHLGAYGAKRDTSPFLDGLAARGQRFTQARSASPWTLPSHLTMLTGRWPTDHQVVEEDLRLGPDVPQVQEALRGAGWATGGFVSAIYVSHKYGFDRGFDVYEDFGITDADNLSHRATATTVVDAAVRWASQVEPGKPIFLFVHLYDVHYPYRPPPPYDARFDPPATEEQLAYVNYAFHKEHPPGERRRAILEAQYDECIRYADDQLRRLHDAFAARPTRWMVVSDHGEEFLERGSWGHGHTLYDEALDIPLILSGAGISSAVRDEVVGTIDVAPTVAALAGVPWTAGPGVDLRDPVPVRPFFAETSRFDTARLSLQTAGRRLDSDLAHDRDALFDRAKDDPEKNDLAWTSRQEVKQLKRELLGSLGAPYTLASGTLRTDGWFVVDAVVVGQTLVGPARFAVYPVDAVLTLPDGTTARAPVSGLASDGAVRAVPWALDAGLRAQLEALGYVQEGE